MTEWILTSSVLILVVLFLRSALKGRISLRLRYALWAIVLVRLLIPFSFSDSAISVTGLARQPIARIESIVREPIRSDAYDAAVAEVTAQFFSQHRDPAALSREELDTAIRQNVYDQVVSEQALAPSPMTSEEIEAEVNNRMEGMFSIDPSKILTAVWLAGVAVMCAVFLWSNARLAMNLKKTRKPLQISHNLPVYMTDYVATPCLFGLFRSTIYLPREAAESPSLHHILAHESTHHRQGDHIWSALRCLCLALHWYNPLVWFAAAASKKDAELACDEATIARLGESQRTAYGETLISMTCARRDHKDLFLTATTMNTGKRTLKERVTMIAKHPKTAIYTLILLITVMLIAVGCTFTGPGNQEDPPTVTTEPTDATEPPATYPDTTVPLSDIRSFPEGEIQAVLLYVNGRLYVRSETAMDHSISEDWPLLGTVKEVDNRKEPAEDFHAAHLPVGTEIYEIPRNPSAIYVKDSETNLYFRMFRADMGEIWWRKGFPINPVEGFEPEGELLRDTALHSVQEKFDIPDSSYRLAVNTLYDSPEKADPFYLFMDGIPGVDNTLTVEEREYLNSMDIYMSSFVSKLSVKKMDAFLSTHFGITLADVNTQVLETLPYWEETDCYYLFLTDPGFADVNVHSAYARDEYIDIYYCFHDKTPTPDYVLTTQSMGGAVWFVSNKQVMRTQEFNGFTPSGTAASEETYDTIAALFQGPYSWYTLATTSCYMTPEEVDLNLLFYNGINREQVTLTDAEKQYLSNTWLGSMIGELEFDRMKADEMDDVLQYHFGIKLDDTIKRGTQGWVYWDKTDCYYNAHNDCLDHGIEIRGIYIRGGGMVDVYYLSDMAQYGVMEYYVITLQLIDNRFVIRSNWYVNETTSLPEPTARFGICVPMGYDSEGALDEYELNYFNSLFEPINSQGEMNILCSFFSSYYESPRELNLTEFLRYNPLGRGITSGGDFDAICREHGYTDFVPTPIHKYEADEVDDCLELYMGIGLKDLRNRRGGDGLTYLRQYNAYYNTTSDAGFGIFTADRGEYSDGKIILYDDRAEGSVAILTLKIQGTSCLIESHMLAVPD